MEIRRVDVDHLPCCDVCSRGFVAFDPSAQLTRCQRFESMRAPAAADTAVRNTRLARQPHRDIRAKQQWGDLSSPCSGMVEVSEPLADGVARTLVHDSGRARGVEGPSSPGGRQHGAECPAVAMHEPCAEPREPPARQQPDRSVDPPRSASWNPARTRWSLSIDVGDTQFRSKVARQLRLACSRMTEHLNQHGTHRTHDVHLGCMCRGRTSSRLRDDRSGLGLTAAGPPGARVGGRPH